MTKKSDKHHSDHDKKPEPIDVFEIFYSSIRKYVDARIAHSKKVEESSLMNRLVEKINSAIKRVPLKPDSERQLVGRIIELNQSASEVLNSLKMIKNDLKKDVDKDLYPFIEAVMKPMIRDVVRIQNCLHDDNAIYKQAEAFKRYSEWVDRAKLWVSLCSAKKDKEAIIAAVIQHTIDDFSNIIERDKRLIEDYLDHVLEYIPLGEEDRKEILSKQIRNALKPYLKSLVDLKKSPKNLCLETLNEWKENSDKRRDRYYNAALQVVDNFVSDSIPIGSQQYEPANLIGLLEQLDFLEGEISVLCERVMKKNGEIDIEVGLIESELLSLEQEVQDLYFDVRMPADALKRLKNLKIILAKAFSILKDSN